MDRIRSYRNRTAGREPALGLGSQGVSWDTRFHRESGVQSRPPLWAQRPGSSRGHSWRTWAPVTSRRGGVPGFFVGFEELTDGSCVPLPLKQVRRSEPFKADAHTGAQVPGDVPVPCTGHQQAHHAPTEPYSDVLSGAPVPWAARAALQASLSSTSAGILLTTLGLWLGAEDQRPSVSRVLA